MGSIDNPKSFLFLPPEIRLLIYRHLLIPKEGSVEMGERLVADPEDADPLGERDVSFSFFDPIRKCKVRGYIMWQGESLITTLGALNLPCSLLPLFLCNSTVYEEAAWVFLAENRFRFHLREEPDWDMLYGWLEMMGRRNICRLRNLVIFYDCVDVRVHKNQQISEKVSFDLSGETTGLTPASYDTWLDEPAPNWFEVISPKIERLFGKLGWSNSPLTVTMLLPDCRDKLVPRLLYPEVDLQEYDPLPLFNPFGPRETSAQEWEYDQAGARYSPKEFCMVPDLIEGYRKKYGKDTLTVQWKGRQYADKWDKTKLLLLRSGWEILRWEERQPAPDKKQKVHFTLRLGRDLTHGCV